MNLQPRDSALVESLEAPTYLRQKCREMQAKAPSLGLGWKKGRLPAEIHQRLLDHFRNNLEAFMPEGPVDEIRTAQARVIPALLWQDARFNERLAEDLRPLHEAWAGMPLSLSCCYGIRCYQRGTFLYNHVDRQPHFVSSSICVDQNLDAPWPLTIVTLEGEVVQVEMTPGDFVFYEGVRLAHGRPYPLQGEFYAGMFVHYFPRDGLPATAAPATAT